MSLQVLLEIVPETSDLIVSLGLPLFHRGGLFNTACLFANGQILGFVGKQNLRGGTALRTALVSPLAGQCRGRNAN